MSESMEEQLDKFKKNTRSPASFFFDEDDEKETKEPKSKTKRKNTDDENEEEGEAKKEVASTTENQQLDSMASLFVERRPRIEDTHTRRTFLIRNDLLERLDDLSNKPKNFTKTKFINYILEYGLEQLEELNK